MNSKKLKLVEYANKSYGVDTKIAKIFLELTKLGFDLNQYNVDEHGVYYSVIKRYTSNIHIYFGINSKTQEVQFYLQKDNGSFIVFPVKNVVNRVKNLEKHLEGLGIDTKQ